MTINNAALTWKTLHAANFAFQQCFTLTLEDDALFQAEKILRLIPKKRMVVLGTWQGKPCVAKLFFDTQHAERHMAKELMGNKALVASKIPTPTLYFQGKDKDRRIHVLLFEYLVNTKHLTDNWHSRYEMQAILPLLSRMVAELATQHVLGILQHDLHLKNFLISEKHIYTLDGADIEVCPLILSKKMSMQSLALFLAQLGVGMEPYQEHLFRYYAKLRGWIIKNEDIDLLFSTIRKWNQERLQKFSKKMFRNSTDFSKIKNPRTLAMYDRKYTSPILLQLLENPEIAFTHPSAQYLKKGGSSTVVKIQTENKTWVIKRYNIKNKWHFIRRFFRETRARKAWRFAQKLQLFGVQTAAPIAFIEKNKLGFTTQSYFITEYISQEDLGTAITTPNEQPTLIKRVIHLITNLAKLKMTHGDLKMTNILINHQREPVLIDLDGMIEHASLAGLRRALKKEWRRLMQNFSDQTTITQMIQREIQDAPLKKEGFV